MKKSWAVQYKFINGSFINLLCDSQESAKQSLDKATEWWTKNPHAPIIMDIGAQALRIMPHNITTFGLALVDVDASLG